MADPIPKVDPQFEPCCRCVGDTFLLVGLIVVVVGAVWMYFNGHL